MLYGENFTLLSFLSSPGTRTRCVACARELRIKVIIRHCINPVTYAHSSPDASFGDRVVWVKGHLDSFLPSALKTVQSFAVSVDFSLSLACLYWKTVFITTVRYLQIKLRKVHGHFAILRDVYLPYLILVKRVCITDTAGFVYVVSCDKIKIPVGQFCYLRYKSTSYCSSSYRSGFISHRGTWITAKIKIWILILSWKEEENLYLPI